MLSVRPDSIREIQQMTLLPECPMCEVLLNVVSASRLTKIDPANGTAPGVPYV